MTSTTLQPAPQPKPLLSLRADLLAHGSINPLVLMARVWAEAFDDTPEPDEPMVAPLPVTPAIFLGHAPAT